MVDGHRTSNGSTRLTIQFQSGRRLTVGPLGSLAGVRRYAARTTPNRTRSSPSASNTRTSGAGSRRGGPASSGCAMSFDGARHEVVLLSVQRQLEQLLDESAGEIGPRITTYRSSIWECRAAAKAAAGALRWMEG